MNSFPPALWAHLHALTVLAELSSYTAAARRLGISKAAMSQRVAELERAAGVQLVQRTTRSVRLTEAGRQLVDGTRSHFEQIGRGFASVRELAAEPRGLVRVTAPVALGRQRIVPHLAEFLRRHPEVRIELDLADRLVPLAQEGFDLAIRHVAAPPDTHVAWPLCETRAWLVASRAYLRRKGLPAHPSELAGHDCLHYPRPGETPTWTFVPEAAAPASRRAQGQKSRDGDGRVTVPVRGPFSANNSEVLREAVLAGLGVALLPDFSLGPASSAHRLQRLLPGWRPVGGFGERIYAIRPYSPVVPRAVRALVAHLRDALSGGFGT